MNSLPPDSIISVIKSIRLVGMKTLIIVIIILLAVLTTPLTIKRALDRGKYNIKPPEGNPGNHAQNASSADPTGSTNDAVPTASTGDAASTAVGTTGSRTAFAELDPHLSRADWARIFAEAEARGISTVFLVGADPLSCREVLEQAGEHGSILFPINVSGMSLDRSLVALFDRCRNLLPVIDLGDKQLSADPGSSHGIPRDIPFGVSITVTTQNLRQATERGFLSDLHQNGCRLILYKEYVAADESTRSLELGEADRALMTLRLEDPQIRGSIEKIGSTEELREHGLPAGEMTMLTFPEEAATD